MLTLLLGKLLNHAIVFKNKNGLKEYFDLSSDVLKRTPPNVLEGLVKGELKGLGQKLFELLKKERSEESNDHASKSLEGYLILLKHFVGL